MENKIWMLTDKDFLIKHKLFEPLSYGVSPRSIERGNTLTDVKPETTTLKIKEKEKNKENKTTKENTTTKEKGNEKIKITKDDIQIFTSNKFNSSVKKYYYILDTLDGIDFRILFPYFINPRYPIYKIPAERFDGFDDIKKYPSRDLENYNAALEGEILKNLFVPKKEEKPELKLSIIREKIYQKVMTAFKGLLFQKAKKQKITEPLVANLITHSEVYQSVIYNTINLIRLTKLKEVEKIPIEKLKYYGSEIMMSYLSDLNSLENRLLKKIKDIYQRLHQEKLKKSTDIKNKAITVFGEVLKMTLEDLITEKSNIYATIKIKTDILNQYLFSET